MSANPIVVKELRQAVRSRFVTGVLGLFLLVLLVAATIVLIHHTVAAVTNPSSLFEAGSTLFNTTFVILAVTTLLFVPAYAGIRLGAERWGDTLDLQFIATLSPARVVRGKLQASTATALLLVSAAAPFLTLSTVLRGVDILSVLTAVVMLCGIGLVVLHGVVMLALLPFARVLRILVALIAVNGLFGAMGASIAGILSAVDSGVDVYDGDFLAKAGVFLAAVVFACIALEALSVFLLSPTHANRAGPLRRTLTLVWAGWGTAAALLALTGVLDGVLIGWYIPAMVMLSFAIYAVTCGAEDYSRRVRAALPRHLPRIVAFPFASGFAGGTIWVVLLSVTTIALFGYAAQRSGRSSEADAHIAMEVFFAYCAAYALTGRALWRFLLRRWVPLRHLWLVHLLLLAVGTALPFIAGLLMHLQTEDQAGAWQYGNIFAVFGDDDALPKHAVFSVAWALVALLANAPALAQGWHAYRPLPAEPQPSSEPVRG